MLGLDVIILLHQRCFYILLKIRHLECSDLMMPLYGKLVVHKDTLTVILMK
jgi:hypothetical protein